MIYSHLVFSSLSILCLSSLKPSWIIHPGVIYLSQLYAAPFKAQVPLPPPYTALHPISLPSRCWIMELDLNGKQVGRHSNRCSLRGVNKRCAQADSCTFLWDNDTASFHTLNCTLQILYSRFPMHDQAHGSTAALFCYCLCPVILFKRD